VRRRDPSAAPQDDVFCGHGPSYDEERGFGREDRKQCSRGPPGRRPGLNTAEARASAFGRVVGTTQVAQPTTRKGGSAEKRYNRAFGAL
jgi:hypothetical protein